MLIYQTMNQLIPTSMPSKLINLQERIEALVYAYKLENFRAQRKEPNQVKLRSVKQQKQNPLHRT